MRLCTAFVLESLFSCDTTSFFTGLCLAKESRSSYFQKKDFSHPSESSLSLEELNDSFQMIGLGFGRIPSLLRELSYFYISFSWTDSVISEVSSFEYYGHCLDIDSRVLSYSYFIGEVIFLIMLTISFPSYLLLNC